jgi:hypothetical protein
MRRLYWAPALGLALWAGAGVATAAPRVEADPNRDYPVTKDAGEWMILVSTFTGDAAPGLAKQLVSQIRSRYGMAAYAFDYADPERVRMREELDRLRQQSERRAAAGLADPDGPDAVEVIGPRHVRTIRVEHQYAVLVGGYKDLDAADAALAAIRKMPAPDIKAPDGVMPFPAMITGEDAGNGQGKVKAVMLNPFAVAHVVRNPALPHEDKKASLLDDKFLLKLNEGEDFSLLKNPHPYTLAVKEYLCTSVIQQSQAESTPLLNFLGLGGGKQGESLGIAAGNAHDLAKCMRWSRTKLEAYVLHTRTSSVVAVGGFDSENDPNIEVVRRQIQEFQQEVAATPPVRGAQQNTLGLYTTLPLIRVPHPKAD